MRINNRYKIESDDVSITLSESYIAKSGKYEGEEQWKVIGWFSTFQGAMSELINREVKRTELKNMEVIMDKIDELKRQSELIKAQIESKNNNKNMN